MNAAQNLTQKALEPSLSFDVGNLVFTPSYIQAFAVVFLLFLLVLSLARLRRMYVGWSLKGATTMLFLGFMLAFVLEGFLLLGGRTLLTEVVGWKNAPKPIQLVLDSGRSKLVDVLGVTEEIPVSSAQGGGVDSLVVQFQSLPPDEQSGARKVICAP